ncbi:hypothetical protein MTO96_025138 [Rhipicephalus appendiculatus]
MSHILIKWKDEMKWDVYLIGSVADTAVGLSLMRDPAADLKSLKDELVNRSWDSNQPPSPAKILAVGREFQ